MLNNSTYLPIINLLRGVAALFVVLFHFVYTTTGYVDDGIIKTFFSYGHLGVTIFFVISGIVIPLSMIKYNYQYEDFYLFFKRRIIRVELPFLASIFFAILYLFLRNYIPSSSTDNLLPTISNIIYNIFYLVPFVNEASWINSVYWTLAIEFQYYLLLALLFPFLSHKIFFYRFTFYIFIFVSSYFINFQIFLWLPVFMVGISYTLYLTNVISKIEISLIYLMSFFLMSIHQSLEIQITTISTILIIHFFKNCSSRISTFFGNISYSLYLTHSITGTALINLLSHHYTLAYQKFLVISIGLALSIISAYVFFRIFEHPSKVLSMKISHHNSKKFV